MLYPLEDYIMFYFLRPQAGPVFHPYELRQTYVSLMIAEGAFLVSISSDLGHTQTSTTNNVYIAS